MEKSDLDQISYLASQMTAKLQPNEVVSVETIRNMYDLESKIHSLCLKLQKTCLDVQEKESR